MRGEKELDTELIHKLINGDKRAFKAIYLYYFNMLCCFATQYVTKDESEEIVQDVMLWLWNNHDTIIPEMNLKSLLFTIVKNKSLNIIKQKKIKNNVCEIFRDKYSSTFDDPDCYIYEELSTLFENSLNAIPEDYREAFIMNRFKNYSYSEIAEIKGVSSKTIAYRISKTLNILRVEDRKSVV